jgi:DNA-binding GntR family transcriptional regulator
MAIVRTVASQAADEIRRRILAGELPAGVPLRQEALAVELGISRIPVREALLQLEAEGLVRIVPHRGAVVAEFSVREIEELFELRALLEPYLLRLSAPRLGPPDFAKLDAIQSAYARQLRAQNVVNWGALNTELHTVLYSHSERPKTSAIVSGLLASSDRYTRMHLSTTGELQRAEREHGELIELCRTKRFEVAAALLKAHIEAVGEALLHLFDGRLR